MNVQDLPKMREDTVPTTPESPNEKAKGRPALEKGLINVAFVVAVVAVVIAVKTLATTVVIPELHRAEAYAQAVSLGNAMKAVHVFESLGDYKDSKQQIDRIKAESKSSAEVGDAYWIGAYEQDGDISNGKEEIMWRVLAVEDGKALLVAEYALDYFVNTFTKDGNHWETSGLEAWLQGDFAQAAGLEDMADRLVYLSWNEAELYFASDDDRKCAPTAYAVAQGVYQDSVYDVNGVGTCFWWLKMAAVCCDGGMATLREYDPPGAFAVRPALWIDL